jgi:hypothetical protein
LRRYPQSSSSCDPLPYRVPHTLLDSPATASPLNGGDLAVFGVIQPAIKVA